MRMLIAPTLLLAAVAAGQEQPSAEVTGTEPAADVTGIESVADTAGNEPAADAAREADVAGPAAAIGAEGGVKTMSGMSVLGNEEAPKALVIVPWKSSRIGDGPGVTDSLDERARPVDKQVFMREVHYYDLRSGGEDQSPPAGG